MSDRDDADVLRAMDPEELTNVEAMGAWDAVIGDMEATVASYEKAGWRAVACHPGDVAVVTGEDRRGVDVLIPDDEFAEVSSLVEQATFDEYEVLRAEEEGVVYAVVVMQDTREELAFCFPVYFEVDELEDVAGEAVTVYLRRLQGEYVELTLEEPELLVPE